MYKYYKYEYYFTSVIKKYCNNLLYDNIIIIIYRTSIRKGLRRNLRE